MSQEKKGKRERKIMPAKRPADTDNRPRYRVSDLAFRQCINYKKRNLPV